MIKKPINTTSRRKISKMNLFLAGITFILLILGYAGWCYAQWTSIERTSRDTLKQVKSDTQEILKSKDLNIDKIAQLKIDIRNKSKNLCFLSGVYAWQSLINKGLEHVKSECEQSSKSLDGVELALEKIFDRIISEEELSRVLASHQATLRAIDKNDIAKQIEAWSTVREKVSQMDVATSLAPAKERLLEDMNGIKAALSEVEAAKKAQKRLDFDAAVKNVAKAYNKLAGIETILVDSYREHVASVIDAIDEL